MDPKLVRNKALEAPGFVPCICQNYRRVSSPEEHAALLLKKLHEKLANLVEVHGVGYSHEINEEGCDLVDAAISFLVLRTGMLPQQIARRMNQKVEAQGSYLGGLVREHL